jgi:hypothetical protein
MSDRLERERAKIRLVLLACCACGQSQQLVQVPVPNTEVALSSPTMSQLLDLNFLLIYIARTPSGPESCNDLTDAGFVASLAAAGNFAVVMVTNEGGLPIAEGSYPVTNGKPTPTAASTIAYVALVAVDAGIEQLGESGTVVLTQVQPSVVGTYAARIVEADSGVFLGNVAGNFDASPCEAGQ